MVSVCEKNNFIVVESTENHEVVLVVESYDFNKIEEKWHQLVKKYPLPRYDIINARFFSFEELKNHLPHCHGWNTAEKEKI